MSKNVKIFVKIRLAVEADFYWVTFEGAKKLKVGYQYYEENGSGGFYFNFISPIKSAADKAIFYKELMKKVADEKLWVADPLMKNEKLEEKELLIKQ